jgi:hypothetical protein
MRSGTARAAVRLKTTIVVYLNGLDTGACTDYHPV